MPSPSKDVPGGCVIGVLALMPLLLAVLASWGLIVWIQLPADKREFDDRFWSLIAYFVGGLIGAILLCWVALRFLKSADLKNFDPDRRHLP